MHVCTQFLERTRVYMYRTTLNLAYLRIVTI